jgi:hypothetical protein
MPGSKRFLMKLYHFAPASHIHSILEKGFLPPREEAQAEAFGLGGSALLGQREEDVVSFSLGGERLLAPWREMVERGSSLRGEGEVGCLSVEGRLPREARVFLSQATFMTRGLLGMEVYKFGVSVEATVPRTVANRWVATTGKVVGQGECPKLDIWDVRTLFTHPRGFSLREQRAAFGESLAQGMTRGLPIALVPLNDRQRALLRFVLKVSGPTPTLNALLGESKP